MRIPIYADLSPKHQQRVHAVLGGITLAVAVFAVAGLVGGPEPLRGGAKAPPKAKALGSLTGEALDSKDVWVGNAGRDMARLRDDFKQYRDGAEQQRREQERLNEDLMAQLKALRGGASPGRGEAMPPPASASAPERTPPGDRSPAKPPEATASMPAAMSGPFPPQPRAQHLPAPNDYPPGTPLRLGADGTGAGTGALPLPGAPAPAPLLRVSLKPLAAATSAAPANAAAVSGRRHLNNFLPIGFTPAVILGGLAAPTGGQAQANPVPVLLRLADAAVLPNQMRAGVKDCFVIGEGYGDQSAERAYIRSALLSCVMRDGSVLEVPLKGSVFGEDGMNGVRGTLVTKQGAILTNALLSGIAAGLGQGVAQASQSVNTTALGTMTTGPTDTAGLLKQGVGTGMGRALDRLSQYYIQLAERTFPVIEVQAGRTVDLVVTQGVNLDQSLAVGGTVSSPAAGRGAPDRAGLMGALNAWQED